MNIEKHITQLMQGAIDLHEHTDPSFMTRSVDTMEAAEECCAAGMRAISIKDHHVSTAANAYFVNKYMHMRKEGKKFDVFGSVCLNNAVGFNPTAVDVALKMGAKLVYMPTLATQAHADQIAGLSGVHFVPAKVKARKEKIMHVLDENGSLVPEIKEIIGLIKEADAVLCTGHLDYEETYAVVKYAREIGMEKISMTHLPQFTTQDHEKLAKLIALGGYVEMTMCLLEDMTPEEFRLTPDQFCDFLRFFGPERCTVATDAGSIAFPRPVTYFREAVRMLLEHGFTDEEITMMIKTNPAKLVGIED